MVQRERFHDGGLLIEGNRYIDVLFDSLAKDKPTQGVILRHYSAGLQDLRDRPGIIPTCQILNNLWQVERPGAESDYFVKVAHPLEFSIYLFEAVGQPGDLAPV